MSPGTSSVNDFYFVFTNETPLLKLSGEILQIIQLLTDETPLLKLSDEKLQYIQLALTELT